MHRIDTPTAQADKFGPGKNGFTNGDPATGRRATDLNSDMWDAVQEEICAVIEKSGLALNKDQHDQLHQAIEKIITSKIPDALLKKNNLSDLADKALARANLQLKTAATMDVTTSSSDTTNGRVLKVGDYGLGVSDGNTENLNSIYDIKCSRLYSAYGKDAINPTEGMPNDSGNTKYTALALNVYQNLYWVALFSSSQFYIGYIRTEEKTGTWTRYYSPSYKPTPSDLGAVPDTRKINNKRLNSDIELNPSDVGAVPDTRRVNNKQLNSDITLNANDVGAMPSDAIIPITQGGTGASTQSGARTNLAAAKSGANSDITSITGLTTALSVTQGGTGAKTATAARANLFAGGIPTALNSAQGWWKCADTGRIFQHGKVVITSGSQLTFPIAFPNACFAVILTDNDGYKDVGLLGATTTYAAFTSGNGGTVTVGYLAIGY